MTRTLPYDPNGRLVQDTGYNYVWNELGQLSEMRLKTNNSLRASFGYDALGRRIHKTINGQTTRYLHDGANPIQLQDASGTAVENLLAGGIDEWFVRTRDGLSEHFITDALGSTIRLTNASGIKTVDYTYDPYGAVSTDTASHTNVFQYTGRENDKVGGLLFNRARYYKPRWGKFISQDPIGLAGGDNLYGYAKNNPTKYRDPTGQSPWWVIPAAIVVYELADLAYTFYEFRECVKSCPTTCPTGDTGPNASCKAKCVLDNWAQPDGPGPKWPMGK